MSQSSKIIFRSSQLLQKQKIKSFSKWSNCKFSSNVREPGKPIAIDRNALVTPQPPLTQALPGLASAVYASSKDDSLNPTRVTTLSNGLRVASENRYGQFCTIGVVIDSGCRYEVSYPSGVSHFLEKLAFQSTTHFPDKDKILLELEKYGGICDCQSSRDTFVYAASADARGLDAVSKVMGDIVLRPLITNDEVDIARQIVSFELESLSMRPEQETLLMDMIHAAAYRDNTLGLPKLSPAANVNKIDRKTLFTYLKNHFAPSRMVVAGVGVDHDQFVESINRYFVDTSAIWDDDKSLINSNLPVGVDNSIAQYTGGMVQENCEIPLFAGPSGLPELAHIVIGFEGCSHQDPDFIPMCLLNMMMGGGGSFSAGGPGKGMYTRLYTNVLNRYHWMYSATAYNHAYSDSGVFCIHASAPPSYVKDMVQVILREMIAMAGEICPVEFRRAKTQLQSMLLMNLESRAVVFEDVARQVLSTNQRKPPQFFIDAIENTTTGDIQRVATRILRSQPSVAARGDIGKIPSYQDIQAATVAKDGRLPGGRLSLRKLA